MAVPENGAKLLAAYSELDIYAAILGYSDASPAQYVTSASVGSKVGAVPECGATLLNAYSELDIYGNILGYSDDEISEIAAAGALRCPGCERRQPPDLPTPASTRSRFKEFGDYAGDGSHGPRLLPRRAGPVAEQRGHGDHLPG